jgi:Helicase associated domain
MGFEWSIAPPKVPWQTRCDDLEAFCILHGHSRVPRMGEYAGLGEWVKYQRRYYKEKNPVLTQERIERLSKIPHFVWASDKGKLTFDERLEECRDFRRQHGHLCVFPLKTTKGLPPQERSFRDWAHNVRCAYRKFKAGLKSRLDGIRIKKLGTISEMSFFLVMCTDRLQLLFL